MSQGPSDEILHEHADVSGGWLRPATFGAMDGLVTNTALIAGVGAVNPTAVLLSGVAGLVAGAFSMALGEYTSVTTANEQIDAEVMTEQRAFAADPNAEKAELAAMFESIGLSRDTAERATEELHADEETAVHFHIVQELGVDPKEKPSALVAAGSSFLMFSIGAVIPLLPYLLGFTSLWAGLICGGVGLLIAGGLAAHITRRPIWRGSARQLLLGGLAVAATYLVGLLVGQVV